MKNSFIPYRQLALDHVFRILNIQVFFRIMTVFQTEFANFKLINNKRWPIDKAPAASWSPFLILDENSEMCSSSQLNSRNLFQPVEIIAFVGKAS